MQDLHIIKRCSDFKAGLDQDNFQSWRTLNNNFNQKKKDYEWTSSQDQRAALYAIKHLGQAIAELDRQACKVS